MKDDEFCEALQLARAQAFDQALTNLQARAAEAAQTLVRNLDCGQPGPEIQAAKAILEAGRHAAESDAFEQRLREIENVLTAMLGASGGLRDDTSNCETSSRFPFEI